MKCVFVVVFMNLNLKVFVAGSFVLLVIIIFVVLVRAGYPLNLLPRDVSKALLDAIRECSAVSQEKAFIYCVDRLLSDLGAGSSTWATRILMLLLIKCNHSVCLEASRIVRSKGVWF